MANNDSTITLDSMFVRLASMMDGLQEGTIAAESADRIIKGAAVVAQYAELEMKLMDLAWSHDRDVAPSGMMRALVVDDPKSEHSSRPRAWARER